MGLTWKQKFNEKNGFDKNESHSKEDISTITGIPMFILDDVYDRGIGAWKTNIESVRVKGSFKKDAKVPRSRKLPKEQWAIARVYGFVMGNKKQVGKNKPDHDLLEDLEKWFNKQK